MCPALSALTLTEPLLQSGLFTPSAWLGVAGVGVGGAGLAGMPSHQAYEFIHVMEQAQGWALLGYLVCPGVCGGGLSVCGGG